MAERIEIELVDKSGPATAPPNASAPGAASVPGSSYVGEFQQNVSSSGAGSRAGAGSVPVGPSAIGGKPEAFGGDPLLGAVKGIVKADEQVTTEELQKSLGITSTRAQNLLNAARGQQAVLAEVLGGPEPVLLTPLEDEEGILLGGTGPRGSGRSSGGPRGPRRHVGGDRVPPVFREPRGTDILADVLEQSGGVGRIGNSLAGVPGAAIGNMIGTALRAVPNLVPAAAAPVATAIGANAVAAAGGAVTASVIGPAAGSLAAMAGPIAAGVGIGAAAIGIPIAVAAVVNNEANRAQQQIRDLSPEVAVAEVRAELRQLRANFRTRDRLGDEVGDIITAKSDLSARVQGIRDTAFEEPLKELTIALNSLNAAIKVQMQILNGLSRTPLGQAIGKLADIRDTVLDKINAALERYLGTDDDSIGGFDWFEDQPFLTPPPPFTPDDLRAGKRRTVGEAAFAPMPGLDFKGRL